MNLLILENSEESAKEIFVIASKSNLFYQIRFCGPVNDLSSKIKEEKPQLVILAMEYLKEDIFPLLTHLMECSDGCLFLVTGNMEDYPSILSALKAGAAGFILRPLAEISIYTALQNASARILSGLRTAPREPDGTVPYDHAELMRIKVEKLLFSLINTENDPFHLYRDLCSLSPEYTCLKRCRVGIISAEHLPLDTMNADSGLASSALARLMNNLMTQCQAGVAISGLKSSGEFSLFFFRDLENSETMCRSLCQEVRRLTGILLHVGLGPVLDFPQGAKESANIARKYAKSYNLIGKAPSTITACDPRYATLPYNFSQLEKSLYAALLTGNLSTIRHCAREFAQTIVEPGFLCIRQVERLRLIYHGMRTNWIESFRVLYAEAAKNLYSPPFVFRLPYDSNGSFSPELLENGLTGDLVQVSGFILNLSAPSRLDKHFLQSVREYIHHNYTQSLSLKQVAGQFGVTPNYLSSAFKKKFGSTMIHYIHELRFQQAKKMLEDPSINIIDIAHTVGFTDAKYFSRIFQKKEGISPREYRKKVLGED